MIYSNINMYLNIFHALSQTSKGPLFKKVNTKYPLKEKNRRTKKRSDIQSWFFPCPKNYTLFVSCFYLHMAWINLFYGYLVRMCHDRNKAIQVGSLALVSQVNSCNLITDIAWSKSGFCRGELQ